MCCGTGRDRQSGGTVMPFPPRLYALASHTSQLGSQKAKVVEIRANQYHELKAKKAVDRANAVLDRLEQRVADYDAQIRLFCEQHLKPLEQRRACAQRRMDRLQDQILAKLSDANLERVDGFSREFQAISCPKAVQVDNLSLVPNEYIRQKPEADKILIKRALERDRDLVIPVVHLTQRLRLVRK